MGAANRFDRLCSAELPASSAFYNTANKGTGERLFMTGEEAGNEGRAYAFVATDANKGNAYELLKLGRFSWENSVANPYSDDHTIVTGMDDSTPGRVYIYQGSKTDTGLKIDKAGLTNGTLAGIKVKANPAITDNLESGQINSTFSVVAVDTSVNGVAQRVNSRAAGITGFARPEDGAWADAKTFYFTTTGADGWNKNETHHFIDALQSMPKTLSFCRSRQRPVDPSRQTPNPNDGGSDGMVKRRSRNRTQTPLP